MEPPSARPWLGVGAALSAMPAAGGCFCAALVPAVVADSDPRAVYEQHRWLGAVVAASAVCAFVAMMGWATLRHGGIPLPVLLMALADAPHPARAQANPVASPRDHPAPVKPAGTDAEPAPGPPVAAAGGRAFVRDSYAALNARRFGLAWRMLSPAVQVRLGGPAPC